MEYQGGSSQNYYNYPEVQLLNASYDPNGYFASHISSHVGVASCNDTRYVASADTFDNASHHTPNNYGYHGQEPLHVVNYLSFDATSNIKHVNPYSSAISSQYMVPPQDMPMNERIGYDNANYLANCSQNLAPYANAPIHNSALYVTPNSSRINENSTRYSIANTHDLVSHVTSNHSQINENLAPHVRINAHNSALYFTHNHSRISEISARHLSAKTCDSAPNVTNNCSRINKNLAMGEEILVRPTTIAKLKVDGITEDSPLFYTMVKVNSTFDKLDEGIFDTPIATSPHVGHTSELALAFSQSQYERLFYYYFDQHGSLILKSQSKLTSSAPETDRASSRGATTIPPDKRLSYYYFDQNGKLNFRKKPVLVSSVPKTDRANLGEATIIPHEKYEKRQKSARLDF
jgi:hypothetical protein